MKRIIDRPDVEKAITDLKANGKKVTYQTVHAALGNRGSLTTLADIMKEMAFESLPINDSPEALKNFREIWAIAREEGRKQQEAVIAGLEENINAFMAENQQLDGAMVSARNEAEAAMQARQEVESALEKANSRLAESQAALILSGQEMQDALRKLAEEQVAHRKTQQDLQAAIQRGHEHQLEAVKYRALLDAESGRRKKQRLEKKAPPRS